MTCSYGEGMASRLATTFDIQCFVSLNLDAEVDEKVVYGVERTLRKILSTKFESNSKGSSDTFHQV